MPYDKRINDTLRFWEKVRIKGCSPSLADEGDTCMELFKAFDKVADTKMLKYQDAIYQIDVALQAPESMLPKDRLSTIFDIVNEVMGVEGGIRTHGERS